MSGWQALPDDAVLDYEQPKPGPWELFADGAPAVPRAVRNNNPGNIRYNPANQWQGQIGTDGAFAVFDTPENGNRAHAKLIANYQRLHGVKTVRGAIERFAPPSENDTGGYVRQVAQQLGVGPDDEIDLSDPRVNAALRVAQRPIEAGAGWERPAAIVNDEGPWTQFAAEGAADDGGYMPLPDDAILDDDGPALEQSGAAPENGQDWNRYLLEGGSDFAVGAARGVVDVAGGIGGLADAGARLLGYDPKLVARTDAAQEALASHQFDPTGWASTLGRVGGEIAATLPVAGVRTVSRAPALAKALRASTAAKAAGVATPRATRLARYGDMAVQGAAAGALASGGHDMGMNAAIGGAAAPAVGRAVEMAAPHLMAGAEKLGTGKLAKAIRDRIGKAAGEATGTRAVAQSESAAAQTIRRGSELKDGVYVGEDGVQRLRVSVSAPAEPIGAARPSRVAGNLEEAAFHASDFLGKPLTNESTGLTATLSKRNLGKMTSSKATQKSATAADHALAVANADELFVRSRLAESHPDAKGEPTIAAIHRYTTDMVGSEGKPVTVKMTVKETTGPNEPNPYYTIEAIDIGKAEPGSVPKASAPGQNRNAAPPGSNTSIPPSGGGSKAGASALAEDGRAGAVGQDGSPAPDAGAPVAPPPSGAKYADAIRKAMGSPGARRGMSAVDELPPALRAQVDELVAKGVPMEQALAEADIAYIGGKPTVANVTRDRAEQQAMFEGAKQPTAEGRALAQRIAENNEAVHRAAQDTVARYGGVPSHGEAAEAAATSLAKASAAERAKVKRLYDAAALEHGRTVPEAVEPNLDDVSGLIDNYWETPPKVDVPDERSALTSGKVANAYGRQVSRRGPMDLVSWLRTKGGIREDAGELKHMGITNKPRDLDFARNEGFLGKLVSDTGMPLDDAALRAWEAGFFPEHAERITPHDLLQALDNAFRGNNRRFHPDDLEELSNFERLRGERFDAEQRASGQIARDDVSVAGMDDVPAGAPDGAYADDLGKMGGSVSPKPLFEALEDVAFKAPVTNEGRALAAGFRRALSTISERGERGLTPADLERLRKLVGGAYSPMGGEVNHLGGRLKGAIDTLFDELGDASPAYKAARAAHREWAGKYDNPEGLERLIRKDAGGNFLHADDWRKAEGGLIDTTSDKAFAQVARQLKANGDDATLDRLKASVVQRAYEAATRSARDERGNAVMNGKLFQDALDRIGTAKLKALFDADELAHLAAIGRAARALNEAVPGTVNTSNTSSALVQALKAQTEKTPTLAKMLARGIAQAGASAAAPGAGNVAVHAADLAMNATAGRASAKKLAEALRETMDPAAARASAQAAHRRMADALRRHNGGRKAAEFAAPVAGAAQQQRR